MVCLGRFYKIKSKVMNTTFKKQNLKKQNICKNNVPKDLSTKEINILEKDKKIEKDFHFVSDAIFPLIKWLDEKMATWRLMKY